MRKGIFLSGIVVMALGGILIGLSTISRTKDVTVTEDIADKVFGSLTYEWYDYETKIYLVEGTFRLDYSFSSGQDTVSYQIRVLDPDGILMKQETESDVTKRQGFLTFETGKIGEHTFQVQGVFNQGRIYLDILKEETETIYPYETGLYIGLLSAVGGTITSIAGALKKN